MEIFDLDKWQDWAYEVDIHHDIIGFMSYKHNSWELSKKDCLELTSLMNELHKEDEKEAFIDLLGKEKGDEFNAFRIISASRPSIQEIEKYPNDSYISLSVPFLFATIAYLASNLRISNINKVMKYSSKMPPEHNVILYYIYFPKTKYFKETLKGTLKK